MAKKLTVREAEELTGMTKLQVSRLAHKLKDPEKYREELLGAAYRAAMLEARDDVRGTLGSGMNEWQTPEKYMPLVREVLGGIDLDPASSDDAQRIVQATRYYTRKDDGLKQEWLGRIWLNPPYAQPLMTHFVEKLVAELNAQRAIAAIMLTHNYTDSNWFQDAVPFTTALCFPRDRVKFVREGDPEPANPTQGQTFWYFGKELDKFTSVFEQLGLVCVPVAWPTPGGIC